jgi:hypothetical protein
MRRVAGAGGSLVLCGEAHGDVEMRNRHLFLEAGEFYLTESVAYF